MQLEYKQRSYDRREERVKNVELLVIRMTSWFVMMYDNYSERELCNQRNRSTL